MKARIHVFLKEGVLDPQGKAVQVALKNMGCGEVKSVRQGKFFDLELEGVAPGEAVVISPGREGERPQQRAGCAARSRRSP